jgi:hypothetical protein
MAGVLHITGLVAEDGAQQFLLREGSVSPFGVILPMRMSPFLDLSADADQAVLVEVLGGFFAHVRDVAVSSSRPRLVSRTSMMYSSMWMEVKMSSLATRSLITMASSKL